MNGDNDKKVFRMKLNQRPQRLEQIRQQTRAAAYGYQLSSNLERFVNQNEEIKSDQNELLSKT